MDHDQPFRSVLIAICPLVFPVAAYHRLKSQATGEKLSRSQECLCILATLRPVGVTAIAGQRLCGRFDAWGRT
jgi:hypothetical protein